MDSVEKRRLEDIKILAQAIEREITNLPASLPKIANYSSQIVNRCDKLQDKALAEDIREEGKRILVSLPQFTDDILDAADEIVQRIELVFEVSEEATIFIKTTDINYTSRFRKDCQTYDQHSDKIKKIQKRIVTFPYTDKLHEKIGTQGHTWYGYRHARLTRNLRIMYLWDEKKKVLTYDAIITKNEFEKG